MAMQPKIIEESVMILDFNSLLPSLNIATWANKEKARNEDRKFGFPSVEVGLGKSWFQGMGSQPRYWI
jgi:hypothetical protein